MEHESAQERFCRLAENAKAGDFEALREVAQAAEDMLAESRAEDTERVQKLTAALEAAHADLLARYRESQQTPNRRHKRRPQGVGLMEVLCAEPHGTTETRRKG
jgi:HPt (histidine-containing phosphotransfer) domain-containing protein